MKQHHKTLIVEIKNLLPHNNADNLEIIHIEGYQVIVKKGEFKVGDLGVYITPDSVVPQTEPFQFIWENYVVEGNTVPEKRRRITVRKFRGEWSEGLLLPVTAFSGGLIHDPKQNAGWLKEGDEVSELLGVTHYDPDAGKQVTGVSEYGPEKYKPQGIKQTLWFWIRKYILKEIPDQNVGLPVYDVEAYKNHLAAFEQGENVFVSEKVHGSNARYTFRNNRMYAGSRNLWKAQNSQCIWRRALVANLWIETWCRYHPELVLYGEILPTQDGFNYGCTKETPEFLCFDIYDSILDKWLKPWSQGWDGNVIFDAGIDQTCCVPVLGRYQFDIDKLKPMADGKSLVVGANHIREGIVISPERERHEIGLGRLQLKLVSNAFLNKDSK